MKLFMEAAVKDSKIQQKDMKTSMMRMEMPLFVIYAAEK